MSESILQNMSAPPRSKIVIAPNKESQKYWKCSLDNLPPASPDFALKIAYSFGFNNPNQLIAMVQERLDTYFLPPVATVLPKAVEHQTHPDKLLILGILARSTGHLYMSRRPIRLDPLLLRRTVFISARVVMEEYQ